jgi:hypothetical protein
MLVFAFDPLDLFPGAKVQFVQYAGPGLADDVLAEKTFAGNLITLLAELDSFLAGRFTQKPVPVSTLREQPVFDYPPEAVLHRDYQSTAPTRFYPFSDRIEIQNPGGLYGEASPENFPRVNAYRNPIIAEAMHVLGYVNRFAIVCDDSERGRRQLPGGSSSTTAAWCRWRWKRANRSFNSSRRMARSVRTPPASKIARETSVNWRRRSWPGLSRRRCSLKRLGPLARLGRLKRRRGAIPSRAGAGKNPRKIALTARGPLVASRPIFRSSERVDRLHRAVLKPAWCGRFRPFGGCKFRHCPRGRWTFPFSTHGGAGFIPVRRVAAKA